MDLKYTYKVYNISDDFVTTLNDVINKPSFLYSLNGGLGELVLSLERSLDNYGEGTDLDFNYKIEVYVSDNFNDEKLIYTGFISSFNPYYRHGVEGVDIIVLPNIAKLNNEYYRSGDSVKDDFELTWTTTEVADIIEGILTNHNALVSYLYISNDYTNIDATGNDITITFNQERHIDAIRLLEKYLDSGWHWYINQAGKFYLKEQSATADHKFILGKDVIGIEGNKNIENVINTYFIWNGERSGTVIDNIYNDATSQTSFDNVADLLVDSEISTDGFSDTIGNSKIAENKDSKRRATIIISGEYYNIAGINPGDTCKILNIDETQTLFGSNMKIHRIEYLGTEVRLELIDTELKPVLSTESKSKDVESVGGVTAAMVREATIKANAGMYWDGDVLVIEGSISATAGSIGGWKIEATTLKSKNSIVELDANNEHIKVFSEGIGEGDDYIQLTGSQDVHPDGSTDYVPRVDIYRDYDTTNGNVRTQLGKILWFYSKYQGTYGGVNYDPCPQVQIWGKDGKEYEEEFGEVGLADKDGLSSWNLQMESSGDTGLKTKASILLYGSSSTSGVGVGEISISGSVFASVTNSRLGDYNAPWSQLYLKALSSTPSVDYLTEGLLYAKSDHHLYFYNGTTAFQLDQAGGISEVKDDTSPQLGGNLDCQDTYRVYNMITPVSDNDATTKKYVDDLVDDYLPLSGGTLTGTLNSRDIIPTANATYNLGSDANKFNQAWFNGTVVVATPTSDNHATTKGYVDTAFDSYLELSGGTLTGTLNSRAVIPTANNSYALGSSSNRFSYVYGHIGNFSSTVTVATPTSSGHAATKGYVDDFLPLAGGTMTGTLEVSSGGIEVSGGSIDQQDSNGRFRGYLLGLRNRSEPSSPASGEVYLYYTESGSSKYLMCKFSDGTTETLAYVV